MSSASIISPYMRRVAATLSSSSTTSYSSLTASPSIGFRSTPSSSPHLECQNSITIITATESRRFNTLTSLMSNLQLITRSRGYSSIAKFSKANITSTAVIDKNATIKGTSMIITMAKKSNSIASLSSVSSESLSSSLPSSSSLCYADIDHSAPYQREMEASHGSQLSLAWSEADGMFDGPRPDPFDGFRIDDDDSVGNNVDQIEDGDNDEGYEQNEIDGDNQQNEIRNSGEGEKNDNGIPDHWGRVSKHNTDGSIRSTKRELRAWKAGFPGGGIFAVIKLPCGRQEKVTVDDVVITDLMQPYSKYCDVGSVHTFRDDQVLCMGNINRTVVGMPGIRNAEIVMRVEELTRDKTVIVFKKRRRKNSRRKNGHRRQVMFWRVLDIKMPPRQDTIEKGEMIEEEGKEIGVNV